MSSVHTVTGADGTSLHVEVDGSGPPLLMLHEVAGDLRSWDLQVAALARDWTCIRYNARGFPPSGVPTAASAYSQERAVEDLLAVVEQLQLSRPHLLGFSMGGFCALHALMLDETRFSSAVIVGVGYGSAPGQREIFQREASNAAANFRTDPFTAASLYALGPTRQQLRDKAPDRWKQFEVALAGHSAVGLSLTFSEVLAKRPSLFALREQLARIEAPVLFVVGDEDDGCLETSLMLKRSIRSSGLTVLPRTGHTPNLEDPERFNALVTEFLVAVQTGVWMPRSPQTLGRGLVGM